MLRVIRNHRRAAYDAPAEYEGLTVTPMGIDAALRAADLRQAAREALGPGARARRAARLPQRPGDGARADRHDRPADGLRHHRRRARLRAGEVQEARRRRLLQDRQPVRRRRRCATSATAETQVKADRRRTSLGTLTLHGAPHVNRETLKAKGFTDADLAKIEAALPGVFELGFAFNPWTLGERCYDRARHPGEEASTPGFDLLRDLGFTGADREANDYICGTMTVEGAPHLKRRAPAGLRLRQQVRQDGQRFIHRWATSA